MPAYCVVKWELTYGEDGAREHWASVFGGFAQTLQHNDKVHGRVLLKDRFLNCPGFC